MSLIGSAVSLMGRGPLLTPHDVAVKRRRGLAIHAYVGPNGAGKSLKAADDTIPTLRGIPWACDNPDHLHTLEGITHGTRKVLSTMPFITPSGKPHPLYVPLVDYSQIIAAEHCDLILDEVGGAIASSTSDDIPGNVKAKLQELRRSEVVCRWTAPSWSRASKVLRETSQGVTLCQGFAAVPHKDGITFDGPHTEERMSFDGEELLRDHCAIEDEHAHPAGRMWGARRLMFCRTFDANLFEEFNTDKRKVVKPILRELYWRPGAEAERVYDTHGYVEKLGQITDGGRCDKCSGRKTPKKCMCEATEAHRGARRLLASGALAGAPASTSVDLPTEAVPVVVPS